MKRRVANPGLRPAVLALLLLVLGGRAGAQGLAAQESRPLVLGLGAAVRLALEASPSLEGAEAALEAADARRDAASRLRLPSALASASYSHAGPVEPGVLDVGPQKVALPEALQDSTSFRIALQQPLYTGGRLSSGIAQADAAKEAALAEAAARRRDIAAAAERAWWGLVLAAESEAAVAENLLAVRSHRADAERRLAEGAATKSELLSWRMQEVEASVRARAADADRAAARARLNVLLGRPWDAPLEAAEEPAKAGAAHLAAGLVISGGGSQLPGTLDVASQVLGMPVRIGMPLHAAAATGPLRSPVFATGVGLVTYAARHCRSAHHQDAGLLDGLFSGISRLLRRLLSR